MNKRTKRLLAMMSAKPKLRTVSGLPPLSYKAKKAGTLSNYRIYGNTETLTRSYSGSAPLSFSIVDGEVSNYRVYGQTSRNLFDETIYNKNVADMTLIYVPIYVGNVDYVTCSTTCPRQHDSSLPDGLNSRFIFILSGNVNTGASNALNGVSNKEPHTIQPSDGYVTICYRKSNEMSVRPWEYQTMLNVGSTALPYEPYGESVGELVTDSQSEHYGEYAIPITNNSETANIYLDEPLRMVGDEAEYVDYATQKWHRVRKNLVQTIATSKTINDITFTVNANGSVTCNGTNHGNNPIIFELNNPDVVFPEGVYITSGCPAGGSITGGYKIQYFNGSSWNYELGSGGTFTLSGNLKYRSRILISKDVTVTNLTFYPMLRLASIEDDTYEPYIENTEVDVTIPALPAQSSTNSLSVGTSVQPSSVAVKVDEVVSCGDKVTDSQSVNYGKYKIPVTLTGGSAETTDIYLDEPLAKLGNNADYIDYATQKRHNSDGTESSVTLPAISTLAGTNTLTVGTEVQPSEVEVTGRIRSVPTGGGE